MVRVAVKVGIPEFLNRLGNGVESHVPNQDSKIVTSRSLLVKPSNSRKLGIPCKYAIIFSPCHA